jgi:hypothetical protein
MGKNINYEAEGRHCNWCGDEVHKARWDIGYRACLLCGEEFAITERVTWCVAPMHKSNYMLITDQKDLVGLNNKGGLTR